MQLIRSGQVNPPRKCQHCETEVLLEERDIWANVTRGFRGGWITWDYYYRCPLCRTLILLDEYSISRDWRSTASGRGVQEVQQREQRERKERWERSLLYRFYIWVSKQWAQRAYWGRKDWWLRKP